MVSENGADQEFNFRYYWNVTQKLTTKEGVSPVQKGLKLIKVK